MLRAEGRYASGISAGLVQLPHDWRESIVHTYSYKIKNHENVKYRPSWLCRLG